VPAFPGEKKSCINVPGVPGFNVENITFSDIHITFPGGGDVEDSRRVVPELRDHYPEYHMFGILPAYGMYVRHAKEVSLENVTFDLENPDLRPALVCEDVDGLELANFRAMGNTQTEVLRLIDTRRGYIHGCRLLNDVSLFANIEGKASQGLLFQANDLRRAARSHMLEDGAQASAVTSG
jgi:hypothetical protein